MDLIGRTLGQYQVIEAIGSGGMATVYKAFQPSLERFVAVKVLSGQLAADPEFRKRFDREAKAAANLSHPHILPVYDSGEHAGTVFMVTELVDGGSLRDRIAEPLEPGVAARIAAEIADALDYAHRRGLVHRDVKPGNVLITRDGRTLLADFGIAKVVAGTQYTHTGMVIGTPAYMSPEQARGEEVDGRSDLYSLGIMLYEMLVGFPPFQGDTPLAVLHQQVTLEPPPPRSLNPAIPKRLEKAVLVALAKDPDARYRTGRELAKALEGAVRLAPPEQMPGMAGKAPPTEPVRRPAARKSVSRPTHAGSQPRTGARRGAARVLWGAGRFLGRFLLILATILLLLGLILGIGGAIALGAFAQRTIPSYAGELQAFQAYGEEMVYTEQQLDTSVGSAVEPYALDAVDSLAFSLDAPDRVQVDGLVFGRPLHLQTRLALREGMLQVYLERVNNAPLYVVGGIVSRGVNRGIESLFRQSYFRLDRLEVTSDQIRLLPVREAGAPIPTAAPTSPPAPTAGPSPVQVGTLALSNNLGAAVVLDLAGQQYRVEGGATVEVSLPVGTYAYSFVVDAPGYGPGTGSVTIVTGRSTLSINSEATSTPLPQATKPAVASKTAGPGPARATPTPSATPTRIAFCPVPGVAVTSPGLGAPLRGTVSVQGSASISGFSYYKLELGAGSSPREWAVMGDLRYEPVSNGLLGEWDTAPRPPGSYVLRLTVVDKTGNYKTCDVAVQIVR